MGSYNSAVRNRGRGFPHLSDLLWLSFLALYLTPWITSAPPSTNWIASGAGTVAFLVIFGHSYRVSPERLLPHAVLTACIGFALAWFGGVWNVFNVLAASIAARLQPRRTAVTIVVLLQLALVVFGLWTRMMPVAWVSGIYFGVLAGGTTMLLDDLDRRNGELHAAQDEIRGLTITAERERIAQDLHDLLGRSLTAIALKANLAARLTRRDPGRSLHEINEVASAAREALSEVRAVVSGIVERSLSAELDGAHAMLHTAGISVTIDWKPITMTPAREATLSMVLREAVTNVVRHSGASRCQIFCNGAEGNALLIVEDNGSGAIAEGYGIAGMRRRLAMLDGTLMISSERGTAVQALLPLSAK
jgi:two-component system sensor histidine kinase DesK